MKIIYVVIVFLCASNAFARGSKKVAEPTDATPTMTRETVSTTLSPAPVAPQPSKTLSNFEIAMNSQLQVISDNCEAQAQTIIKKLTIIALSAHKLSVVQDPTQTIQPLDYDSTNVVYPDDAELERQSSFLNFQTKNNGAEKATIIWSATDYGALNREFTISMFVSNGQEQVPATLHSTYTIKLRAGNAVTKDIPATYDEIGNLLVPGKKVRSRQNHIGIEMNLFDKVINTNTNGPLTKVIYSSFSDAREAAWQKGGILFKAYSQGSISDLDYSLKINAMQAWRDYLNALSDSFHNLENCSESEISVDL